MRLEQLQRKCRKASRELGIDVEIIEPLPQCGWQLKSTDFDTLYLTDIGTPSKWEQGLAKHHARIYHDRGRRKLIEQNGKCAMCSILLSEHTGAEIDHIESRGAHGRDDSMSNIRVLDRNCHRRRHGERVKYA